MVVDDEGSNLKYVFSGVLQGSILGSIMRDTEYYKDTYIKRDDTPLERAQTKKLNVLRKSKTEESRKKG